MCQKGLTFELVKRMSISYCPILYNSPLSDDSKCAQKLPSSSVQVLHLGELRHRSAATFREKWCFAS